MAILIGLMLIAMVLVLVLGQQGSQQSGYSWNESGASGFYFAEENPYARDLYNQLLTRSVQNYNQILLGYNNGMQNIQNNYQSVLGGVYDTLGQGGGWGVARPAAQQIAQTYAARRGATDQSMVASGLGNTTVRQSMQNQNALGEAQAYGGLGAQLANMYAGYQSQLGGQFMQQQSGLTGTLLNQLGGYQFQQPLQNQFFNPQFTLGWSIGESRNQATSWNND